MRSPETEATGGYGLPVGSWELNSVPQEEQQAAFLTTEPSLQPLQGRNIDVSGRHKGLFLGPPFFTHLQEQLKDDFQR